MVVISIVSFKILLLLIFNRYLKSSSYNIIILLLGFLAILVNIYTNILAILFSIIFIFYFLVLFRYLYTITNLLPYR